MMTGVWALDAMRAEVDYRTEELRKAARGGRLARERRARRKRTVDMGDIVVPMQRRGSHDREPLRPLRRAS